VTLAAVALGFWGRHPFGALNPEQSLRMVVPSATLLILGVQITFSSCLLGVLQLDTRTSYARTRKTDFERLASAGEPLSTPLASPADRAAMSPWR